MGVVIAYIDGANLHKGVERLGWKLDYKRFRVWLADKYDVEKAYIFLGFILAHKEIYAELELCGFCLIFKETVGAGKKIKGNCDTELVLKAAQDFYNNHVSKAVLVSSDGDYTCLVEFLSEHESFRTVISPGNNCSVLLMRTRAPIVYLDTQRSNLEILPEDSVNKKAPDGDGTP